MKTLIASVVGAVLAVAILVGAQTTYAAMTAAAPDGGNTFSTLSVAAVTGATATSQTGGTVKLSWTASATAAIHSVAYTVSRRPTGGSTWTLLTATPITATTYSDTPSTDGTYDYSIATVVSNFSTAATVGGAISDRTAPVISAWAVCDVDGSVPPAAPDWATKSGNIRVYAQVADAGVGVATVTAAYGLTGSAPSATPTLAAGSATCAGTTYNYSSAAITAGSLGNGAGLAYVDVVATDGLGYVSHSNAAHTGDVGGDKTAPAAPAPLAVTGTVGTGRATITWVAVSGGLSGLAGYEVIVYLAGTTTFPAQYPAAFDQTGTSVVLTLTSGVSYDVYVLASDNAGNDSTSGKATFRAP